MTTTAILLFVNFFILHTPSVTPCHNSALTNANDPIAPCSMDAAPNATAAPDYDFDYLVRDKRDWEEDDNLTYFNESVNGTFSEEEFIDSLWEMLQPKSWTWILVICHTVVFVVGIIGNILVCVAVYRNHTMRTVTNYFIVNLAVADFLVILFCLVPSVVWDVTVTWFFGVAMCKIVLYFQSVSVTVSVLTLTFISIDRWYAICFPLKFKSTTGRAKTAIAIIWIVALACDDQLILDHTKHENIKDVTIQRLKEFSYYLTDSIEKNLNFCLAVLEGRSPAKKSNSGRVEAIRSVADTIPYIGRSLSSALRDGEIIILNNMDAENARSVADLVYFFNDHKEAMRLMLIESSMDIFYSFEQQFVGVTCEGGARRAMKKLAKDAANRIFNYFLDKEQNNEVTSDDFSKGVVLGWSELNNKETDDEDKWMIANIYSKVGLFSEDSNECFGNEDTDSRKYGYRKIFMWENMDEIHEKWIIEMVEPPSYNLKKEESVRLISQVREYIMRKSVEEATELDREKKHEVLMGDYRSKHEEVMDVLLENFGKILDVLGRNYEDKKKTVEEKHRISDKLSEIHSDVRTTKDRQEHLQQQTDNILDEISRMKKSPSQDSPVVQRVADVVEVVQKVADVIEEGGKRIFKKMFNFQMDMVRLYRDLIFDKHI